MSDVYGKKGVTMDQPRGTEAVNGIQDLAAQIQNAYDAYRQAMLEQMGAADELRVLELDLEATQDAIILAGYTGESQQNPVAIILDGKNAETRAAQLRAITEKKYLAYRAAEGHYQQAKMDTTLRYELLRTLRAIASLAGGPHA